MKKFALCVAAFACLAGQAFGQATVATGNASPSTNAAPDRKVLKRIGAAEADNHYDELAVVTGKVVQVSIRPAMVYLNFEKPYPSNLFTAVIFAKATNQFSDLSNLKDKQVEISGKVVKYHNKPELILENSNQLTVVPMKGEPDKSGNK
jgi:hypothetical protein